MGKGVFNYSWDCRAWRRGGRYPWGKKIKQTVGHSGCVSSVQMRYIGYESITIPIYYCVISVFCSFIQE